MPLADCPVPANATVLARGPQAVAAHRRAVRQWELLTGAALAGLASKALEIGVGYVLQRRAFGVLIASFQTIQHRLADNATAVDGARLLAYEAAWAHDAGQPAAASLATMSFLFASETAFQNRVGEPAFPRRLRLHAGVRHPALLPAGQSLAAGGRRSPGRVRRAGPPPVPRGVRGMAPPVASREG